MTDRVGAAPDRLEAYTAATVPAVDRTRAAVEDYRQALAAFNAAGPDDLGLHLEDVGAEITGVLEELKALDRAPARFAAALRALDRWQAALAMALQAMGGAGPRRPAAPGLLERIEETARSLRDTLWNAGWLDDAARTYVDSLPDDIEAPVDAVTERWLRMVAAGDQLVESSWSRSVANLRDFRMETRQFVATLDIRPMKAALPWLRGAGTTGDAIHGFTAAREQWREDAGRPDLSPTERWVRAGTDGVVRGTGQAAIAGTVAWAVGAAAPTGGASLVLGGALAIGGAVAGEQFDAWVEPALDRSYERWADDVAHAVDEAGREVADAADAGVDWAGDRLDDATDVLGPRGEADGQAGAW